MSPLEQQLKELQAKKLKAETFRAALTVLEQWLASSKDSSDEEFGVREEVKQDLKEVIEMRITEIETGTALMQDPDGEDAPLSFTQDEITTLKEVVARLNRGEPAAPSRYRKPAQPSRGAFADDEDETEEPQQPRPRRQEQRQRANMAAQRQGRQDVIAFAMQHRGLDQRRVSFQSKGGQVITGKVVGTDMPNIVVQTDTGHTVGVPPEKLTVA